MIKCESCHRTIQSHKWAKIRAHDDGWYFQKDGRVFCPEHRPSYAPKIEVKSD